MKSNYIYLILILFLIGATPGEAADSVWWKLPSLPQPENYGNILIDRASSNSGMKPVGFSHWSHRVNYTCRVCHFELEINMMLNTTEITEEQNRYGRYCGACHNGKIAFAHTKENCEKCHNGDITYGKEKFGTLSDLPPAKNGNGVDWVEALNSNKINPANYVLEETRLLKFEREVVIESPWAGISPVPFPHKIHGQWLDCSNCHPDIFQIKYESTSDLAMEAILNYEFCGVCHGRVSFPPNDNCKKCHTKMKSPGKIDSSGH